MSGTFGWCITGHHSACPTEIGNTDGIARCTCGCHEEEA